MPPKAVSILCVLQVAVLIASQLAMKTFAKSWEHTFTDLDYDSGDGWNGLVWFARWGIWLMLLVPLVTMLLCGKFSLTHRGIALVHDCWFWGAVLVTLGVLFYGISIVGAAMSPPRRIPITFLDI